MSIPSIERIPMSFARADWETIRAALLFSIRNHERNQARPSAAHEQHLRVIIANELRKHADDHRPNMPRPIDQK